MIMVDDFIPYIIPYIIPYYTFARIKRIITQEIGIKSHHHQLKWKHEIICDEDAMRKYVMYIKNKIHFELKINDF